MSAPIEITALTKTGGPLMTPSITLGDLIALPRWVAWQTEDRPDGKPTKVPYSPSGAKAKADNPRTWGTRAEVQAMAGRLPRPYGQGGIGIEFGELGDGLSIGGIDLDTCCAAGGALAPWAADVVALFASYTETSPSGTGAKIFFQYDTADLATLRERGLIDPGDGAKRKPAWGRQFKRANGSDHAPAIELHLGNRYFTVTDQALPQSPEALRLVTLPDLEALIRMGETFKGEGASAAKTKTTAKASDGSRSAIAFRKGAALRRAGKSKEEMCAALRDDPETADWCREKGDANGGRELQRIWDKAGETADAIDLAIASFNTQFMVVNEAGKAVIYAPAEDPILHRRYFNRLGFGDLRALYMNRRIEVGRDDKDNPIMRPVADVWLQHAERQQFIRGVIFDPSSTAAPDGFLNLWQGFVVQPRAGPWSLMKAHIRDVICCGDPKRYSYLIRWLARMVQRPAKQGEVAVVMRGGEGTGKGTLARAMTRILGQHALAISNSKHLTGNFNAHLRDCVFLFADEAFYAGDKQHVGVLKSIITEPYLTIEGKFQNTVQTPNFLHLMMASNEEWVVPASLDARRFFVLEISSARKDDHAYFAAIWQEMDAGGYEAMLHDLLHLDLTTFNVRRVPVTDGLQQQRKLSLGTTEAWWSDVLHRGYVFRSKLGLDAIFGQWYDEVTTELLFASYTEFAERRHERHPLGRETFGRFMVSLGAKPGRLSDAMIGEHITDVPTPYGSTRKAEPIKHPKRPPGYALGTLDAARVAFCVATGLRIEWPCADEQNAAA
jgi:hypothetical protein